jgi:hypothetical protein
VITRPIAAADAEVRPSAAGRAPSGPPPHPAGTVLLVWALVRLPALALLVYLCRNPVLDLIERQFDVLIVTRFVIDVLSTPVLRLVCATGFFGVLLLAVILITRLRPLAAYVASLMMATGLLALVVSAGGMAPRRALIVLIILAANLAPASFVGLLTRAPRMRQT